MGLTLDPITFTTTAAAVAAADKSINVDSQGSASAIMYTVPAGRTFIGYIWCNTNTYIGRVNDVSFRNPSSGVGRLEVRLTAGDVFKASPTASDYTFIQGLESNA